MPYSLFPNIEQITHWGNICGDISSQRDLIGIIEESSTASNSCLILPINMSKYGLIYSSEYLFPAIIKCDTSQKAKIIAAAFGTETGSLNLAIKVNGTDISGASSVYVKNEIAELNFLEPTDVFDGDVITIDISSAENALNLFCVLYVKFEANDES